MFRDMMGRAAAFSGVKILTYCLMSNHFHMLIEVPERGEISHDELIRRLKILYRGKALQEALYELDRWKDNRKVLDDVKRRYFLRMYDLSEFMKTLKQRFSFWYNKSHERSGPLWNGRFKSVLVESPALYDQDYAHNAITTMAAYIDLNPVRAGLVDDPKDYRWCGYGEAVAGKIEARNGIGSLLGGMGNQRIDWRDAAGRYRMHLYLEGTGKKGFSAEETQEVLDKGGLLSRGELLRCRVRYFSDGFVFGSKSFVDDVFENNRSYFGKKRKSGARKMGGGEWNDLCVARDLKKQVIAIS